MIEETFLLDLMIKYCDENGIRAFMQLMLRAIEATKREK